MSHRPPGRKPRRPARPILWTGDSPGGDYTQRVLDLGERIAERFGACLAQIEIRHDADCRLLTRRGICSCSPDVVLTDVEVVR